jgi:hypothetical protein
MKTAICTCGRDTTGGNVPTILKLNEKIKSSASDAERSVQIYRVYHSTDLYDEYPCVDDGIRIKYNTEFNPWGRYLNEFCVWFDESVNPTSEFVGIEHYRRTFGINTDNKNKCLNLLVDNGSYVYQRFYNKTACPYLKDKGLEKYHNQICKFLKENNYLDELRIVETSGIDITRSMFIMRNEHFQLLRKFLIEIKNHILEVNNINTPEDALNESKNIIEKYWFIQPHRFIAYILEYMTDVWIRANLNAVLYK